MINDMARFKIHLKRWIFEKSKREDRRVTQREVAQATGLSMPAISRMYTTGKVQRLEADKVAKLMHYFDCSYDDLIEFEE